MLILTLRTDKPEAEIELYRDRQLLCREAWTAHRQLAETIHKKILALLKSQNFDWHDIEGVVAYEGPGSFTGLRIGLSVANALAGSLDVGIVGASGSNWQGDGISNLLKPAVHQGPILPVYGSEVHVTAPKK